jgi:O-acetyl-ADP-ribose deacetylase (regulator of RNase III)
MIIEILLADITTVSADAIVNAANSTLMGGGGVDGAIHRRGGPEILQECREIRSRQGGCDTGDAVITTAGKLAAKYVIHTVGPVWRDGSNQEAALLQQCYVRCLDLATQKGLKTIAFPNISTGVYRFPKTLAATVATKSVRDYKNENATIERVIFVSFDPESYELYHKILNLPD